VGHKAVRGASGEVSNLGHSSSQPPFGLQKETVPIRPLVYYLRRNRFSKIPYFAMIG